MKKEKSADERSEEMVTTGSGQGLLFCSVFVVCAIDFARVNGSLRKYARSLRSLSSSALRCARVPYLRCMRTRSTIMASPKRAYTERIIFMENLRECGGSVRKKNFCVNKRPPIHGGLFGPGPMAFAIVYRSRLRRVLNGGPDGTRTRNDWC